MWVGRDWHRCPTPKSAVVDSLCREMGYRGCRKSRAALGEVFRLCHGKPPPGWHFDGNGTDSCPCR
jgi:hypothetical protein